MQCLPTENVGSSPRRLTSNTSTWTKHKFNKKLNKTAASKEGWCFKNNITFYECIYVEAKWYMWDRQVLVDLYFPTFCTFCTSSQHTLLICIQNSRWQACFYFMFIFQHFVFVFEQVGPNIKFRFSRHLSGLRDLRQGRAEKLFLVN